MLFDTDMPPVMGGSNGSIAGRAGLVPKPAATDNQKFLRGDGTYAAQALNFLGSVAGNAVPATSTAPGDFYVVTSAGTSQTKTWAVGDWAIYNGTSGSWTQQSTPAGFASDAETQGGALTSKAVTPASLETQLIARDNRAARAAILESIRAAAKTGRKLMELFYGDSLTMGATGGTWLSTFWPGFTKSAGYGGPGYFSGFSEGGRMLLIGTTLANLSESFNLGANGWSQRDTPDTTGNGKYGLDGRSIYQAAASNLSLYFRTPRETFTKATLFYLEQSGGGTFNFGKPGNLTALAVNTAGSASVMRSVSLRLWGNTMEDNIVTISSANGAVEFYGLLLENDVVGGTIAVAGKGGEKAQTFAALNGTAFTSYITALRPVVVNFNLGTNDVATRTDVQYKADLQTLITNVRNADATVPIIITVPYTSSNLASYQAVLAQLTTDNTGVYLFWWRDFLGATDALVAQWQIGGGDIHPTIPGNALLGTGQLALFAPPAIAGMVDDWPWQTALTTSPNLILSTSRNSDFSSGATDWSAQGTGTIAITGGKLRVTTVAANDGGSLWHAYFTSAATIKQRIAIRLKTGAASGGGVWYAQLQNPSFAFYGISPWPDPSQFVPANSEMIWILTPTTEVFAFGLFCTAGGATMDIAKLEIMLLPAATTGNPEFTTTATGTTGAQTITTPAGNVNFAASAQSLVVTNPFVTPTSIIWATVATDDTTAFACKAIPAAGSFTLKLNAAATAETKVNFEVRKY